MRCDYFDDAGTQQPSDSNSGGTPIPGLTWSTEIEATIDRWRRIGQASIGAWIIDLHARGHSYSREDLHLMHTMMSRADVSADGEYTIWHFTNQHTLIESKSRPYLVHACLAFTAVGLAWEQNSASIKTLAYHHGAIALRGLQEAMAVFADADRDAILLASLLLSWQANDCKSWLSLTQRMRSLISPMDNAGSMSYIHTLIEDLTSVVPDHFASSQAMGSNIEHYNSILQQVYTSLETLQPYITGRREGVWIEQIKDYVDRLLGAPPPQSTDQEFEYLYVFRKYLFWVPPTSLRSQSRDPLTLVVLAFLYSTAMKLGQIFPTVGPALIAKLAARPLREILDAFDNMPQGGVLQNQQITISYLLDFPRMAAEEYRSQVQSAASVPQFAESASGYDTVSTELSYSIEAFGVPVPSPAFGPMAAHSRMPSDHTSGQASPFLEVPQLHSVPPRGMAAYEVSWPVMSQSPHSEYEFTQESDGLFDASGGFVAPQLLWT